MLVNDDGTRPYSKSDLISASATFVLGSISFSLGLGQVSSFDGDPENGILYIRFANVFDPANSLAYRQITLTADSDLGGVVYEGLGLTTNEWATYSYQTVPEPASWAMMVLGFGAIGGALRRHRRVRTTVRFA